jgi:hypothetical protein
VREIAQGAATEERGTGFQPVICESHSQDGCTPFGLHRRCALLPSLPSRRSSEVGIVPNDSSVSAIDPCPCSRHSHRQFLVARHAMVRLRKSPPARQFNRSRLRKSPRRASSTVPGGNKGGSRWSSEATPPESHAKNNVASRRDASPFALASPHEPGSLP